MPRFAVPILSLAGLLVGVTLASAAPTAKPSGAKPTMGRGTTGPTTKPTAGAADPSPTIGPATDPKPSIGPSCPVPSQRTCLAVGYLDSECGRMHKATCKPYVEDGLAADPAFKAAPATPMLRPRGTDIPKDFRTDGKKIAYGVSAGDLVSKRGTQLPGRTKLTNPQARTPAMSTLKTAHRNPGWDSNGQKITSCAEYAYEKSYDWARFTDASAKCGPNKQCVIDVAMLPSTPGIAKRTLKRKDGNPLAYQFAQEVKGALPKNLFYAFGGEFVYATGGDPMARTPELDALQAQLDKGKDQYGVNCTGTCKAVEKLGDEWDFHAKLLERNRDVSDAEHQEYQRRKDELAHLFALYGAAIAAEKAKLRGVGRADVAPWVSPLDEVANPIEQLRTVERMAITRSNLAREASRMGKGVAPAGVRGKTPAAAPGVQKGNVGNAGKGKQVQGALDERWAPGDDAAPVAVLGMIPGGAKPGTTPNRNNAKPAPDPCHPKNFDKVFELFKQGPISCRIGRAIRREHARMAAGQKSCLDPANDDCDWSPQLFMDRFVEGVPYLQHQQADEQECLAWTGNSLGPSGKPSITATDAFIATMKADVGEALKELEPYNQGTGPKGKKFGADLGDAETYGDMDTFGAGYDYTLQFGVEPSALDAAKNNRVCQLGAHARGGFGVDATFIGMPFEIVDGLAAAAFNGRYGRDGKNDPTGAFGDIGNKKADVHAHLRVLGIDIDGSPVNQEVTLSKSFAPEAWRNRIQLPPVKPQLTIMAGPVPISGAIWAEFFYGASFKVEAEMNGSCDADNINFIGRGIFTPELGLDGRVQLGVGIAGLLSVGVRGGINLVTIGVPITNELIVRLKTISEAAQLALAFTTRIGLSLGTLSGWLSAYVEFLVFEEEFEIVRWAGLSTTIDLMPPVGVELPLVGMK